MFVADPAKQVSATGHDITRCALESEATFRWNETIHALRWMAISSGSSGKSKPAFTATFVKKSKSFPRRTKNGGALHVIMRAKLYLRILFVVCESHTESLESVCETNP